LKNQKDISLFIVTGRTGHSLVVAKALPFVVLEQVKTIYLFSESVGFSIPKCKYITIPALIRKIKPVFLRRLLRSLFEPVQLFYYSIKLKPDFINGVYCLPKGLNSFIVSRLTGVKCVNSIIGSVLEVETELPFKKIWRNLNLWHLKGCDSITIKGETDRQYLLSKGIEKSKLFQLNGAINLEKFFFTTDFRKIDLLFVGSFIELKGTDRIIRIVQQLFPFFPNLNVVMVGEGIKFKEARELASKLGVKGNILFEGYQTNTIPYFQQSKLLVMPSRSESLPTSMLEAMACGCVPVISAVGNVAQAAMNNINSRVIRDYNDLDGFVEAISDLLKDEPKRLQFAQNGRTTVENFYSVESQSMLARNIINYLYNN
jgi:glycosyltransferase involved in cell wall biosynthesis